MKHIILDTDLGGDADDVLALLFALNSPELHIDLIVTSDEHKGDRARYAKEFLSLVKRRIPVVSGVDLGHEKLFVTNKQIINKKRPVNSKFLEAMKCVIEKNKITYYVCIGPQSNLSLFIKKYPKLKDKVKIIFMGGAINYRIPNCAEHNIKYDAKSAVDVFYSDWDKKYIISDTTFKQEIRVDEKSTFFLELKKMNKPCFDYIVESIMCLFKKLTPETYMHDPLTLSCLIDENIINFETKKISINNKGIMRTSSAGRNTLVSTSADYDLFWRIFRKRIFK